MLYVNTTGSVSPPVEILKEWTVVIEGEIKCIPSNAFLVMDWPKETNLVAFGITDNCCTRRVVASDRCYDLNQTVTGFVNFKVYKI